MTLLLIKLISFFRFLKIKMHVFSKSKSGVIPTIVTLYV